MAKIYDALKRTEQERWRQRRLPSAPSLSDPVEELEHSWRRWLKPRVPEPQLPIGFDGHSEEMGHLAARLYALEHHAATCVPTGPDVVLQERLEAIESRFNAFAERALTTSPPTEPPVASLEAQLAKVESGLLSRLSEVADHLDERTDRLHNRIIVLSVVLAVVLLWTVLLR